METVTHHAVQHQVSVGVGLTAVAFALAAALIFLALCAVGEGGFRNFYKVFWGADGVPSTSKFQFFVWTLTLVPAYVLLAVRNLANSSTVMPTVPQNLLYATGFSIGTVVAAKVVATSQAAQKTAKTRQPVPQGLAALIQDDSGNTDLTKVQTLVWTGIAIGIFIAKVWSQFLNAHPPVDVPDIDATLMALMGLGQATYIGKKLVTKDTPRITEITAEPAWAGGDVTIHGAAFGTDEGSVILDGHTFSGVISSWGDSQVKFTLPPEPYAHGSWVDGHTVHIGLMVNGTRTANTGSFTLKEPKQDAGTN